jgi:hypothetical protein
LTADIAAGTPLIRLQSMARRSLHCKRRNTAAGALGKTMPNLE